ncbi:MAG: ATP-binding protein [Desulfococcaceae bacterium]
MPADTDNKTQNQEDGTLITEIGYHRKLNPWIVIMGSAAFLFFSIFHFCLGNRSQSLIFALLFINAIASLYLTRMKTIDKLIRLKQLSGGFAFGLLAVSLWIGLLSDDIYIFLPWLFLYPFSVSLFFGKQIGIYSALAFTIVTIFLIISIELPCWDAYSSGIFKLNTILALVIITNLSLMSEKIRTGVQNDLVRSQNEYKTAEKYQREANVKLQYEFERRIQSEKLLSQSEERYRALFEESAVSLWEEDWSELKIYLDKISRNMKDDPDACLIKNSRELLDCKEMMRVTAVNQATLRLFRADEMTTLMNNLPRTMTPQSGKDYLRDRIITLWQKGKYQAEIEAQSLRGERLCLLIISTIPAGFHESWSRIFTSVYDVTERIVMEEKKKRLDYQMQQTRQMQAAATLAGGIAHQFNNALAGIYGNLDLIRMKSSLSPQTQKFMDSIDKSAGHMHMLTGQLMAYARGSKYMTRKISVNDLIQKVFHSDRIRFFPAIKVSTEIKADIHMISGDITQLETVIAAIISNAVESMDNKGELYISAENRCIDHNGMNGLSDIDPGSYAVIHIRDTGSGMDAGTRERIFEPFFTTKFCGRGLGMSAAYGIVQNHGGMIRVDSAPNQGTCVEIWLPGMENTDSQAPGQKSDSQQ